MNTKSVFFSWVFLILSCQSKTLAEQPFPLLNQFTKYINEIHNLNELPNGFIFIMDSSQCGTCNEYMINFISETFLSEVEKHFFLINKNDEEVQNLMSRIRGNFFFDNYKKNPNITGFQAYGLTSQAASLLMVNNGTITDWAYLDGKKPDTLMQSIKQIRKFERNFY